MYIENLEKCICIIGIKNIIVMDKIGHQIFFISLLSLRLVDTLKTIISFD